MVAAAEKSRKEPEAVDSISERRTDEGGTEQVGSKHKAKPTIWRRAVDKQDGGRIRLGAYNTS